MCMDIFGLGLINHSGQVRTSAYDQQRQAQQRQAGQPSQVVLNGGKGVNGQATADPGGVGAAQPDSNTSITDSSVMDIRHFVPMLAQLEQIFVKYVKFDLNNLKPDNLIVTEEDRVREKWGQQVASVLINPEHSSDHTPNNSVVVHSGRTQVAF